MVSLELASYRRVIARSPATPVILGIHAKKVVIWMLIRSSMRPPRPPLFPFPG